MLKNYSRGMVAIYYIYPHFVHYIHPKVGSSGGGGDYYAISGKKEGGCRFQRGILAGELLYYTIGIQPLEKAKKQGECH